MSKINGFVCDVCGKENRPICWQDAPTTCDIVIPASDTQYKAHYDDVCPKCAHAIRDAVSMTIYKLTTENVSVKPND